MKSAFSCQVCDGKIKRETDLLCPTCWDKVNCKLDTDPDEALLLLTILGATSLYGGQKAIDVLTRIRSGN